MIDRWFIALGVGALVGLLCATYGLAHTARESYDTYLKTCQAQGGMVVSRPYPKSDRAEDAFTCVQPIVWEYRSVTQ